MQTTSLKISKRLYELSGWKTGDWYAGWTNDEGNGGQVDIPKYDLGYLLRKLPPYIATHDKNADDYKLRLAPNWGGTMWDAEYVGIERLLYFENADTPEDAAGLLAIKLFEEGVLK